MNSTGVDMGPQQQINNMKKFNELSPTTDSVLVTKKGTRKGSGKGSKWFSISNAFKDHLLTEAMVSLGNSFELPALFERLG